MTDMVRASAVQSHTHDPSSFDSDVFHAIFAFTQGEARHLDRHDTMPRSSGSLHFGACFCQQALNALLQAGRVQPDHVSNRPSTCEQYERRSTLDHQSGRDQRVVVNIHLRETQFSVIAVAQSLIDRGQHQGNRI